MIVTIADVLALVKQGKMNVLHHIELLDEVVGLEDEANACSTNAGKFLVGHAGHVVSTEEISSRGRPVEAAQNVQEGGLAGTGRPHDGRVTALLDLEV